ncbi:organic solute transporter Ostalpha-domain-containing protein [Zopfochytrium polystomum]|nr:organic solute transporter Ostalpha-domain-containing protein [Zopfochytrium polystomum]
MLRSFAPTATATATAAAAAATALAGGDRGLAPVLGGGVGAPPPPPPPYFAVSLFASLFSAPANSSECPVHTPPPPPDWDGGDPLPDHIWVLGWSLSGFLALFAIVTSSSLICLHLGNWTKPALQRHIVRILFMVPSYAVCAFISYRFPSASIFINLYRDCYEGFAVYSFFNLCLLYLGHTWEAQRQSMRGSRRRYPPPMCCLFYDPKNPNFLVFCKLGIIQLVLVRIFTSSFTVILEMKGLYCPQSMNPRYGHFWAVLLNSVGMGLSMFTLLTFYLAVHENLPGGRPVYQFLSIKYVLFISYAQTIVLQLLVSTGRIHGDDNWTVAEVVNAVSSSLTCLEMAIASLLHVVAFPYTEFVRPRVEVRADGEFHIFSPKPGFLSALVDAMRPDDLWEDAIIVADSLLGWVGLSTGLRRHVGFEALVEQNAELRHSLEREGLLRDL